MNLIKLTLALTALALFVGCAAVPQKDRGYLSDPIMQLNKDKIEKHFEQENFPRREGSTGGGSGAGGGCGC